MQLREALASILTPLSHGGSGRRIDVTWALWASRRCNNAHQSYLPPLCGLVRGDLLEHAGNRAVLLERVWDGYLRRLDGRGDWRDRHHTLEIENVEGNLGKQWRQNKQQQLMFPVVRGRR